MAISIVTNIEGLERVAPSGTAIQFFPLHQKLRMLRAAQRADHLVVHFILSDIIAAAGFLAIAPFHRCRLTTLDFFVADHSRIPASLIRWSLRRVDRFLVYFRNSSIFESRFGISKSRFYYVPFKINGIEIIERTPVTDQGYIFSGGRSRRDFAALFSAAEALGYPVKLVTSSEADMRSHGSSLEGLQVPPNVEISRDDQNQEKFLQSMAGARLVVIPIVKHSTTQAGIGVYLQAMALQKCVIISSSLGVSDVLTDGQASIVPAGDVNALQSAIERLWKDDSIRRQYADTGHRYALPLGGEDALRKSVLDSLP